MYRLIPISMPAGKMGLTASPLRRRGCLFAIIVCVMLPFTAMVLLIGPGKYLIYCCNVLLLLLLLLVRVRIWMRISLIYSLYSYSQSSWYILCLIEIPVPHNIHRQFIIIIPSNNYHFMSRNICRSARGQTINRQTADCCGMNISKI